MTLVGLILFFPSCDISLAINIHPPPPYNEEGNGKPTPVSLRENPMDGGARYPTCRN